VSCNARAHLDYETLKQLRDNGLRLLLVGFESGNQQILNRTKKGLVLDTAREFMRNCRKLGIRVHGTFMIGLPIETQETIEKPFGSPKRSILFRFRFRSRRLIRGQNFIARHFQWLA